MAKRRLTLNVSMTGPNIFHHAKSELSQDAFLAWLCEWADMSWKDHPSGMHEIGRAFISWLYERRQLSVPDLHSVEVKLQEVRIDVLVILTTYSGAKRYILIEDKTYTSDHREQINGYLRELTKKHALTDSDQVLTVYFKSSLEPRKRDEHLRLYLADIVAFITSLDRDGINSEVFNSWCDVRIEEFASHQRYLSRPVAEWESDQWYGCFDHMAGLVGLEGTDPDYDYVHKADFIAFTLGWQPMPSAWYSYVQVVAGPGRLPALTFRLMAPDGTTVPGVRVKAAFAALAAVAARMGKQVTYPKGARGGGKSACFAVLNEPFMVDADGMFDEVLMTEQLLAGKRMLEGL